MTYTVKKSGSPIRNVVTVRFGCGHEVTATRHGVGETGQRGCRRCRRDA